MSEHELKQLRDEVETLKKAVATQMPHMLLLLAIVKTGIYPMPHRGDIIKAICLLPLNDASATDAEKIRAQAKELLLLYFPQQNA